MKLSFNVQPFKNRKWAISTVKIRFKSHYWITILSSLKTKRNRKITLSEKKYIYIYHPELVKKV